MEDLVGKLIGRYQILSELGQGGMAVVYKALDTNLDRFVAIKLIRPELCDNEKVLKRFYREAKAVAKLSHSNIVKVLDYGEYQASPYLVMEYISGGTINSMMGCPIPYKEAAAILAPIARALAHAHTQKPKVIHRDVKPANILLNESGQALLSDFGILKTDEADVSQGLTGTGAVVGTPAYMAPEQIRASTIDGRTDIYALGVVLFEMITGKKPYNANTFIELSLMHLNDPIPRARQIVRDIPSEMENIIIRAMAKKPEDRFQSMDGFAEALENICGIKNSGSSQILKNGKQTISPKRKLLISISIAGLLLALGGVGYVFAGQIGLAGFPKIPQNIFFSSDNSTPTLPTITPSSTVTNTFTPSPTLIQPTLIPSITPIMNTPTLISQISANDFATNTPPVNEKEINSNSVNDVVELKNKGGISVIDLSWNFDGTKIINIGSNGVTLIEATENSLNELGIIDRFNYGEIPIALSVSQVDNSFYLLFSNSILNRDINTKTEKSITTSGGAYSFAVSNDDKQIALGMLDNKVQLRDSEIGNVLRTFRSNYGGWSVAFSPDNEIIAAGTSQGGLMWEVETGTWLPLEGGQNSLINCITFSPDATVIAAGSNDQIYIWDVNDGELLFDINEKMGTVHSLDISPNSELLLSSSDDGILRIWDIRTGTRLKTLSGHLSAVSGAYFSPNGERIVSGANEGVIRLWGIP